MFPKLKAALFAKVQSVFSVEIYQMMQNTVLHEQKHRAEQERLMEHATCQSMVGKPVISVGNDWSNPVIGIGKEVVEITQANRPRLVILDYLTGQEVMPFGTVMDYDETRFEAIMKLNPFEVSSLVYRYSSAHTVVAPDRVHQRESREVILEKLTRHGFFEAIKNIEHQ
jgi:hypothetical protein